MDGRLSFPFPCLVIKLVPWIWNSYTKSQRNFSSHQLAIQYGAVHTNSCLVSVLWGNKFPTCRHVVMFLSCASRDAVPCYGLDYDDNFNRSNGGIHFAFLAGYHHATGSVSTWTDSITSYKFQFTSKMEHTIDPFIKFWVQLMGPPQSWKYPRDIQLAALRNLSICTWVAHLISFKEYVQYTLI